MKVLAITSNPEPESLTNAVGEAFLKGASRSGARTELLDLYREGFNPVYTKADREHYLGRAPLPADVARLQAKLEEADVIALAFPVYWYTMPAMVKGLFDRVICRGFAYDENGDPKALKGKKVRVFLLTGGAESWYRSDGIGEALENQIARQTFGKYCGVDDVELIYVDNLAMGDDAPEKRDAAAEQLAAVERAGEAVA